MCVTRLSFSAQLLQQPRGEVQLCGRVPGSVRGRRLLHAAQPRPRRGTRHDLRRGQGQQEVRLGRGRGRGRGGLAGGSLGRRVGQGGVRNGRRQ